jgi:succinoglycan biosynthesis protein ExoA
MMEMPIRPNDYTRPLLSVVVVIPCLNEEEHIGKTLAHFVAEPADIVRKIVVVDGGSADRTLEIVRLRSLDDSRIVLQANDRRIQSSGVNRAVELYGELAPFIVRVDAHADYPAGFCQKLLEAQEATGAASVVVSMISRGSTCFQTAAAVAQNSRLGNGGSAHRSLAVGRFVDHGHHALMSVSAFREVGGYDETFSHNEDAELDLRLIAAGHRIYLCTGADITYYPRKSALSLFHQYRNFGKGRAMTTLKHRAKPKLRQMIPLSVGPVVAMSLLWWVTPILTLPAVAWAFASLTYGVLLGVGERSRCACCAGVTAMLMHLGFSVGFISQVLRQARLRKSRSGLGPQLNTR